VYELSKLSTSIKFIISFGDWACIPSCILKFFNLFHF
jgi:hypothetical protein